MAFVYRTSKDLDKPQKKEEINEYNSLKEKKEL